MNNDTTTSLQMPEGATKDALAEILRDGSGGPSRSPARGGRRDGGDECQGILFAPFGAENSSTPSHRFANEMGHPARSGKASAWFVPALLKSPRLDCLRL